MTQPPNLLTDQSARVVVTGAGGFVGRALCAALVAHGHEVCAWVRDSGVVPEVAGVTKRVVGDLIAIDDFTPLLEGVSHVVHLATSDAGDDSDLRPIHVDVTRRLVDGARCAGVSHFVFTSSVRAVAGESSPWVVSPQTPCRPEEPYGRGKLDAERLLTAVDAPPSVWLLRLPMVYGPGAGASFTRLTRWVGVGMPVPVSRTRNRRSVLYIGNLSEVVRRIVDGELTEPGLYQVTDPGVASTRGMVEWLADATDRNARVLAVPDWLARALERAPVVGAYFRRLTGSLEMRGDPRIVDLPFSSAQGFAASVESATAVGQNTDLTS